METPAGWLRVDAFIPDRNMKESGLQTRVQNEMLRELERGGASARAELVQWGISRDEGRKGTALSATAPVFAAREQRGRLPRGAEDELDGLRYSVFAREEMFTRYTLDQDGSQPEPAGPWLDLGESVAVRESVPRARELDFD